MNSGGYDCGGYAWVKPERPLIQEPPTDRAEFLAWCLADFRRFCGLLKVVPKHGGARIPFVLSPLQRALDSARSGRDVVCKGRQVHATTIECARDLWWFLTRRGARVVVVCQSQADQAAYRDIAYKFDVFIDSLRSAGLNLTFGSKKAGEWTLPKRDATMRIIQAGGSEVSASNKGRGGTINRLHFTEAAFWGEYAEQTFNSLSQSVPTSGSEIINESTANGAAGFYYNQWKAAVAGTNGYKPIFLKWWLHPEYALPVPDGQTVEAQGEVEERLIRNGATAGNLLWWRRRIAESGNAELALQEFPTDPETCFLLSGRCFFDATILAKQSDEVRGKEPRATYEHDTVRVWEYPRPGKSYLIGADTSEGMGGDPSGGIVYDRETGQHVATIHGQFQPWDFAAILAKVGESYNDAVIAVERNNHGNAVLQALDKVIGYERIYEHTDEKLGWPTNVMTRTTMLDALDAAHRRGSWSTPDPMLLSEMRSFVVNKYGKAEAQKGDHDDLVMAAAVGFAAASRRQVPRSLPDDYVA